MRGVYECEDCGAYFQATRRTCVMCGRVVGRDRDACRHCGTGLWDSRRQRCPRCGAASVHAVSGVEQG